MRKQYASSVYSQKSTTSAKSGRSYLSLTTPIWPSSSTTTTTTTTTTTNDININETKQGVWQNLKNWTTKKKNDTDSITTTRSSSSINKLKQLFNNTNTKKKISSPRQSIEVVTNNNNEEELHSSSSNTPPTTINKKKSGPVGILVNNTESSAEAIAERKRRRHQRREHILKLQMHHRSIQQQQHPHHHLFHHTQHSEEDNTATPIESSSSDTLLTTEDSFNSNRKMVVGFHQQEEEDNNNNDWGHYNPRIMFVEPSPVPRFRNVAPPPPPSPPYLNILVNNNQHDQHDLLSILTDTEEPTIFTQRDSLLLSSEPTMEQVYDEEELSHLLESLKPKPTPKLYFSTPLYRGQILKFSLQNVIPEDHIILFKFLTSNCSEEKYEPERYFVRPSAGKITSKENNDIVLFLNHVPTLPIKKDKIMIRWAVIQKNTAIETWVHSLHDSTRKKWIDMLDEQFPDQVTIRMTRIKIRFL